MGEVGLRPVTRCVIGGTMLPGLLLAAGLVFAADDAIPPAVMKAKSDFDKAVEKAQADHDAKVEAAKKLLDEQKAKAQAAYLKQLDSALIAETKKGNLAGANAVKAIA